jgi:hypothetical protein
VKFLSYSEDRSQSLIHDKGFDIFSGSNFYRADAPMEYRKNKIKVGVKTIEDAILKLGSFESCLPGELHFNKRMIFEALAKNDYKELRKISNHYYKVSGIYKRTCDYFAFLYRYDWYVSPEVYDENPKEEKILKDFSKILSYLDNSYLKKVCGEIALEVIKNGCYYGYITDSADSMIL